MPDIAAWETHFREALKLQFVLASVSDLDPETRWTAAEKALANAFESPERRTIWLHGRSAVKLVLARLGEDTDTSGILFPAPRFSLSHCRFTAVAVGLSDGTLVDGIGIDLELGRTPPERSMRFFLTEDESKWVSGIQHQNVDMALLRLWTVKEALFKADPDNAGRVLTSYRLEDPSRDSGRAFAFDNVLEYSSFSIPGGMLSVAILRSAALR